LEDAISSAPPWQAVQGDRDGCRFVWHAALENQHGLLEMVRHGAGVA